MQQQEIPVDGVNVVSNSAYRIMNDEQFKKALEAFGWYVNNYSQKGFEFYNRSGNCKLVLEQEGRPYVTATFRNMASSQINGEPLVERMLSTYAESMGWLTQGLQYYENFNPHTSMNQFNA